ncbi:MAG: hypothetical protein KC476_00980 [Cyanobacteria bacterium HKST-UBA06]|nr:hypothetical protein [Cyanobacteria bacterium HKST-UBA05]MCA9799354.1 hypothetical protein [Cyanobacteria bacterium HKST-UBA04]MCA9806503.1 hypothetical protein [Cyanobacteria bacterium HKST-UBA06]MCA9841325.1 hypothetical protein [Cyanobacteria bacterium HKST-UBA03]
MVESMVPVCPLLSTRSEVTELCLGEQCAFYVAPVRKCALYVIGHKSAVDLQGMQQELAAKAKQGQ